MTDDDETARLLGALGEELSLSPTFPGQETDALRRQAAILDGLFHTFLAKYVGPKLAEGQSLAYSLPDLLRIQKQCADTARTAAAIDYMRSLSPATPAPRPLPPSKTGNELKDSEK